MQVTPTVRSRPSVAGMALALATSAAWSDSLVDTTTRSEPSSRTMRVKRRVSTPSMATMPCLASHSGRELVARRLLGMVDISRRMKASAQPRALSASSSATP